MVFYGMRGLKVLKYFTRMLSTGKQDLRVANVAAELSSKERKIDIGGQTVNYIKVGNGAKHIMCFPGMFGTIWTDFKPQIDSFDRSKFTVIAWDPPGYGESRPADKHFHPDFFETDAEYAQKLMKNLGISRYSLLGWSDGGVTSLLVAAKYPENVEKLVVWGTGTVISPFEEKLVENLNDLSTWSEKALQPMVALYTREGFQKMVDTYTDTMREIQLRGGDICNDVLEDIKCPTFILHGDKDPLLALDQPLNLLENIEGSKLFRFPNGKHNIHLRYPEEFNKLVSDFILE